MVERAKRPGNLGSHFPPWTDVFRQAQTSSDANDVSIQRNDEPRWGHSCPHTQIDRVAANHPAKKQIEAFARASAGRTRKEIADAGPLRHPAIRRREIGLQRAHRKRLERRTDVGGARIVTRYEESFN